MPELVVHLLTQQRLTNFSTDPGHALLLVGPAGIGKLSLAHRLIAQIMNLELDRISEHQYVRIINAGKEKSISIEKVRQLEQFLSRKVPGDGRRSILIED